MFHNKCCGVSLFYLGIQTPPSEPCHYEKNTAGRSEHICGKEGNSVGRETFWDVHFFTALHIKQVQIETANLTF